MRTLIPVTVTRTDSRILAGRWLALAGYFALIIGIYLWHVLIHHTEHRLISLMLVVQLGPLMFPLRGLLHARIYTHAWSIYLAIFYFVIGVWYASSADTIGYGLFLVGSSLSFFTGCVLFTRFAAREAKSGSPS